MTSMTCQTLNALPWTTLNSNRNFCRHRSKTDVVTDPENSWKLSKPLAFSHVFKLIWSGLDVLKCEGGRAYLYKTSANQIQVGGSPCVGSHGSGCMHGGTSCSTCDISFFCVSVRMFCFHACRHLVLVQTDNLSDGWHYVLMTCIETPWASRSIYAILTLPTYFRPAINPKYFSAPVLMFEIFLINSRIHYNLDGNISRASGFLEEFHNTKIRVFGNFGFFRLASSPSCLLPVMLNSCPASKLWCLWINIPLIQSFADYFVVKKRRVSKMSSF